VFLLGYCSVSAVLLSRLRSVSVSLLQSYCSAFCIITVVITAMLVSYVCSAIVSPWRYSSVTAVSVYFSVVLL
jgi:hypothetical protein